MSEDNLKLWKSVEKTNPAYTKNANVGGNKITSISPQFQIMNVTEKFGSYGKTWGFKNIELDYSLVERLDLVVFKANFFYPEGEFPIINSIKLFMDNAKTKVDDNFAKKIETDALTKAISKLGFNADIFMGKFDDVRYVEEMKEEFKPVEEKAKEKEQSEAKEKEENRRLEIQLDLDSAGTIEELGTKYKSLTESDQVLFSKYVTTLKEKLTPKK